MLNRVGESRRSYLVLGLRKKVLSFTVKYGISCIEFFVDDFYQAKEISFYS